jgi:hypothetical protein
MGLIWGVRGGWGSPDQGVPRRHKLSGGERWWWSRGVAEGVGQGGRGSSWRRCRAWGADRVFEEGSEWRSAVA